MANSDKRCVDCNWLNKEVGDNYICSNCGNGSIIQEIEEIEKIAEIEEAEEVTKPIKKSKLNSDLIK